MFAHKIIRSHIRDTCITFTTSRRLWSFNKNQLRPQYKGIQKGKVSPIRTVPNHIPKPPYIANPNGIKNPSEMKIEIKNEKQIQSMRKACDIAKQVLQYAGSLVKEGITTDKIDELVHEKIISYGAYPSPLGYHGFPKSICTSVNEVICHGIPDSRPLQNGDIINIDVTVYIDGHHGDNSGMFCVGKIDEHAERLLKVTKEALHKGIEVVKPGVAINKIGAVIGDFVKSHKLTVVPDLAGHGLGSIFHAAPIIHHVKNPEPGILMPGMTFTIEPAVVEFSTKYDVWEDNWTMLTKDKGWAAQYEHTVLVTDKGVDILTL